MTFAILVQPQNGQFAAALVGAPDIRANAATRSEAIAALEAAVAQRVARGELLTLEIARGGLSSLAGKYHDDPTLREICEEAYRQRDAEPVECYPRRRRRSLAAPEDDDIQRSLAELPASAGAAGQVATVEICASLAVKP